MSAARLNIRVLSSGPSFAVRDVRCAGHDGWSEDEVASGYVLVLVRRGCFRRRTAHGEALLDPASAYFEWPDVAQRIAHPHDGGDACTAISLEETAFATAPAAGPVYTSPAAELQHRTLLNASDPDVALEAVTALVDTLLAAPPPRPPAAARRRLVDGARETLAASPAATLTELADGLAVSPHHLSRVFRGHTGETVSRYRNRVRVRCALERIRDGEPSLARLAADLGFADHAHLTRAVVRETGAPPSRFRRRAV